MSDATNGHNCDQQKPIRKRIRLEFFYTYGLKELKQMARGRATNYFICSINVFFYLIKFDQPLRKFNNHEYIVYKYILCLIP